MLTPVPCSGADNQAYLKTRHRPLVGKLDGEEVDSGKDRRLTPGG